MKARVLTFTSERTAEFISHEISPLKEGQALIQNQVSLLSPGTELALYMRTHVGFDDPEISWARYPIEAGYASVGLVTDSRNPSLKAGQQVMHYGAHADFTVVDSSITYCPVPDHLDPETAVFSRFAQIAYSSLLATARAPGEVLVYGAGIVGNLAAQWFTGESTHARITDLNETRLEMAKQCGLDTELSEETTYNTIVEATGSPAVVNAALRRLKRHGQLILLGSTRGTVDINLYKHVHRNLVSICGAHETIQGESVKKILSQSLDKLASNDLIVKPLVTHRIKPEQIALTYEQLIQNPGEYTGVLVHWSER
ncbi:MAG: hypothetical protein JXK93_07695 [Sphaerochaetaceae bacterium]|nr:hypothetical protein [Sphaerochaetaceae bacterium]